MTDPLNAGLWVQLQDALAQNKALRRQVTDLQKSIQRDFVSMEDGDVAVAHTLKATVCKDCGKLTIGKEDDDD